MEPVQAGRVVVSGLLPVGASLSWAEARQSPCLSCPASYCCTHVMLQEFELRTLVDFDVAQFLLNFEGVVLGLDEQFRATVYLHQPCSYLETATGLCTVYDTDLQPAECRHYPALDCQARRRLTDGNAPDHPLLDRGRLDWLVEHLYFDDDRILVAGPDWPAIIEGFASRPLSDAPAPPPPADEVMDGWREVVLGRRAPTGAARAARYDDAAVIDPCSGCQAYCCEVLVFDQATPTSAADLEHFRFLLGFPSVELAIFDDEWRILVHVTCRHLEGHQCGLFGQPERPLHCRAYSAIGCEYKPALSRFDPETQVRVKRDLFPLVERSIAYTEDGAILAIPPAPLINQLLTDAVRAGSR